MQCAKCADRVEMVMPSLTTLFADATRQLRRNERPLPSAVRVHQRLNQIVLLLLPRTLDELWIQHFLPTMKALTKRRTQEGQRAVASAAASDQAGANSFRAGIHLCAVGV